MTACRKKPWCRRGAGHPGLCRRKASKKDAERMLASGGLLTKAEQDLWRKLTGK